MTWSKMLVEKLMVNRKQTTRYAKVTLAFTALLGLTLPLSGCSKNDDSNNCRDLFTSSCLLSHGLQKGSLDNSIAQLQANATAGDSTATTAATLSSTNSEVTTQATDPDEETLVYKILDRLPGTVDVISDGTYRYTPDSDFARTGGVDSFEITVRDHDHLHNLRDLFGNRDRLPADVPITFPDRNSD